MTITTPAAGIVSRASTEGQQVSAGQVLYVIDRDANLVDGPTQQQVISALIAQQVALQREYSKDPLPDSKGRVAAHARGKHGGGPSHRPSARSAFGYDAFGGSG